MGTITSDDQDGVLEGLEKFVDAVVLPLEAEAAELLDDPRRTYDDRGTYAPPVVELMRQVRMASADAGYYLLFCPETLGGAGLGAEVEFRVWERLHHRYGPGRLLPFQAVSHWAFGPSFLLEGLSPTAKEAVLPAILDGSAPLCFAMSEPDAGSDVGAMSTRAVRSGSGWVINGTKQWISRAAQAAYAIVFAVTDEELRRRKAGGVTAFLVPMNTAGVQVDSVVATMGRLGGDETILSFHDVCVDDDHVIGATHQGFALAIAGVSKGRVYNSGRCVGLARWALERAISYTGQRETFGRTISEYQGVSFPLANSAIDIYAARSMALDCARRLDRGERAVREVAMMKAFAAEMCERVYDRCMQVHGAMGLTNELGLYEGWHTARETRIADGSGEILRRNVAAELYRGNIGF